MKNKIKLILVSTTIAIFLLVTGLSGCIAVGSLEVIGEGAFPKWSPDGSLIAFTKEGINPDDPHGIDYQIYTMNPNGNNITCLTCNKTDLSNTRWRGQPYWHPSGEYIVFTAETAEYERQGIGTSTRPGIGRNHNVWIMSSDASQFWQITNYPDNWGVIKPGFSHDGKTLYWNEEFSMEKYPNGKPTDPDDDPDTPGHQGHPGSYWGWENFEYRIGEELGAWRVKLADVSFETGAPEISNIRHVDPPEDFTLIEGAGFTPNDDGLIYSYADLTKTGGRGIWGDIYISDLNGESLERLTKTPFAHDENPEFSPDGKKILWNHVKGNPGDGEELWIMNTDGTKKIRLTYFTNPRHDEYDPIARQITEITWNPNGESVIFGHVSTEERGGPHLPSNLYLLTFEDSLSTLKSTGVSKIVDSENKIGKSIEDE